MSSPVESNTQHKENEVKIYVCVKNVPDATATIRLLDQTQFNKDIPFEMNPSDEFAIEAALQLREKTREGGASSKCEVILVTYGPSGAETILRHGLAMGADRAIFAVADTQFSDSKTTTTILAKAIEQEGQPDLILTGSRAMDTEGMQTPYRLAAYFDLPVTSNLIHCEFREGRARVHRELDQGDQEVLNIKLPCVLGMKHASEDPRTPKIRDVMQARKKEIQTFSLAQLTLPPDNLSPTKTEILKLELPPEKPPAKILAGDVKTITHELMRLLREEAQIL